MQLIHQYCGFIRTSLLQRRPDGSTYVNLADLGHFAYPSFHRSFLTDLPGLGEKQNAVSLFEPQAQQ